MKLAKFIGAAAIAALTGVGPTAQAATITTLFNTGVGPSGTPLADNTVRGPSLHLGLHATQRCCVSSFGSHIRGRFPHPTLSSGQQRFGVDRSQLRT